MIHPSVVLAVSAQCGLHNLAQAGIWAALSIGLLYCIIFIFRAHHNSKGSPLATLGAIIMCGIILWGAFGGGVGAMTNAVSDSMNSVGFNSAPTDVSNPTKC